MQPLKKITLLLALTIPFGLACTERNEQTGYGEIDGRSADVAPLDPDANENDNEITQGHVDRTTAGTGIGYDDSNATNTVGVEDTSADRTPASTTATTGTTADTTKRNTTSADQKSESLKNAKVPLTDEQYAQAERALQKLGYQVSPGPRGGPETTRAIQDFQNENQIPATGTFDEMTLRRLGVLTEDRQPASVNQKQTR